MNNDPFNWFLGAIIGGIIATGVFAIYDSIKNPCVRYETHVERMPEQHSVTLIPMGKTLMPMLHDEAAHDERVTRCAEHKHMKSGAWW